MPRFSMPDSLEQNKSSLDFWKEKYKSINEKKDKYQQNISLRDLNSDFENYRKRIFSKNSKLLLFLLSKIRFLNFYQTFKIKLSDHNKVYNYSIFDGLVEDINLDKYDIKMHSQSLSFIFKNEYGFDTLTVNGCFEANYIGFTKVTKYSK